MRLNKSWNERKAAYDNWKVNNFPNKLFREQGFNLFEEKAIEFKSLINKLENTLLFEII